jgi:hypothetical protein
MLEVRSYNISFLSIQIPELGAVTARARLSCIHSYTYGGLRVSTAGNKESGYRVASGNWGGKGRRGCGRRDSNRLGNSVARGNTNVARGDRGRNTLLQPSRHRSDISCRSSNSTVPTRISCVVWRSADVSRWGCRCMCVCAWIRVGGVCTSLLHVCNLVECAHVTQHHRP